MTEVSDLNKQLAAALATMKQSKPSVQKSDDPADGTGLKGRQGMPEQARGEPKEQAQAPREATPDDGSTVSIPIEVEEALVQASREDPASDVDQEAEAAVAALGIDEETTTEVKRPDPVQERAQALMSEDSSLTAEVAEAQATADVDVASKMVKKHAQLKTSGQGVDTIDNKTVREFIVGIERLTGANPDLSEFDAAMQAVAQFRRMQKQARAAQSATPQPAAKEPAQQAPAPAQAAEPAPAQAAEPAPAQAAEPAPAQAAEPAQAPAPAEPAQAAAEQEAPAVAEPAQQAPAAEDSGAPGTLEQTVSRVVDAKLELFGAAFDKAIETLKTELSGGSGGGDVGAVVDAKLKVVGEALDKVLDPMKTALLAMAGQDYEGAAAVGEFRTEVATRLLVKALAVSDDYRNVVQEVRDAYGTNTVNGILDTLRTDMDLMRTELAMVIYNCEPEALETAAMQQQKQWVETQLPIILNRAQECRGGDA
jgi:hypothetical protein